MSFQAYLDTVQAQTAKQNLTKHGEIVAVPLTVQPIQEQ